MRIQTHADSLPRGRVSRVPLVNCEPKAESGAGDEPGHGLPELEKQASTVDFTSRR
jgi:hypothetical protein